MSYRFEILGKWSDKAITCKKRYCLIFYGIIVKLILLRGNEIQF